MSDFGAVQTWIDAQREGMLSALRGLVEHESPSRDKRRLDELSARLAVRMRGAGARVETCANPTGGDHLRAWFPGANDTAPPALVMAHFDTVWPVGTLAVMPFHIADGLAHGPGIYDMKAALIQIEYAMRAISALGLTPPRPVQVLLTSDEEIGSPTSRGLIEEAARGAAYALVPEPPLSGGALKTARKGVGVFTLEVHGRAAHAGVEPEKGASAVVELAHQILRVTSLANAEAGTTVNIGVVQGGTTGNVIPARAVAEIDVRAWTTAEADRITAALHALQPVTPETRLKLTGGFNRPPMERTPRTAALYERARSIGRELALDLTEGSTGGASDGNFTAAAGLATLDGLGSEGEGAHAPHEKIQIHSLPQRTSLLAALLLNL